MTLMHYLYPMLRPAVMAMDPEVAHDLTLKALATGLYPKDCLPHDPRLAQTVAGIRFETPVGLAAGFDKNAAALAGCFAMGFGFVEAGTVTPRPQDGNPRPRLFRDPASGSVINRMGFPNKGVDAFLRNYDRYRTRTGYPSGIVGFNLGKNKDTQDPAADYLELVTRCAPLADYLAINISSPNTPGLRDLQKRGFLLPFLADLKSARANACKAGRQPPLFVKLAPDLSDPQLDELAQTLVEAGIDGVILTNTTLDRPATLPAAFAKQQGGLSGTLLRDKSTTLIRRFYTTTQGKLPIIGVGGIASADDAYAKIRAGASLVQLYTAMVYHGPALVHDIRKGLVDCLNRDGFRNLSEAVGTAV